MGETQSPKLTLRAAYGRVWREWLRPYRWVLVLTLALMALTALSAAGYAKFMEWVIGAYETADYSVVWWGPAGIIALTMTKGLSQYSYQVIQNTILARVQAGMQEKMYDRLLYMDLSNLLSESPAALATRFSADITLAAAAARDVFTSVTGMMTLVATFSVMLSIDWALTIGLILIFTLALGPVGVVGSRVRRLTSESQANIASMTETVNEGLSGIRMVRTYRLEERMKSSASTVFQRLFALRRDTTKWNATIPAMMEILGGIATAALLFLVAWRLQSGAINLAGFIGLLTGLGVATSPARKLGNAYTMGLQGVAALERIYALFDTQNAIEDGDFAYDDGKKAKGRIEFRDVGFVYPDGFQALHTINLTIEAGKTYAFVGRSGAGKSTIFNLLPRLFDVSSGQILLDGADIRGFKLGQLRDQISVVSQDSVLLSGTVIENIAFGRDTAEEADVYRAAKAAAAHKFIRKLPDAYQTVIDPSTAKFSGGEKQRLSIARAILRDAPVLLLDEPTSALDAESEHSIRQALDELSEGRTTLVIAHRLSTILDADQIVVMDQGRIVDQGRHDELLERGGIYAELYNLQFDMGPRQNNAHEGKLAGPKRGLKRSFAGMFRLFGSSD